MDYDLTFELKHLMRHFHDHKLINNEQTWFNLWESTSCLLLNNLLSVYRKTFKFDLKFITIAFSIVVQITFRHETIKLSCLHNIGYNSFLLFWKRKLIHKNAFKAINNSFLSLLGVRRWMFQRRRKLRRTLWLLSWFEMQGDAMYTEMNGLWRHFSCFV